jgi:7-cyano-7-deazaguanine synthase
MSETMDPRFPESSALNKVAVLASGGIDSSVLLCELARRAGEVVPIHMTFGLRWERDELAALEAFLAAVAAPNIAPLKTFRLPLDQIYDGHWSLTGREVPGADTPDEAVYLPGRNLFQLIQPAVWCHVNGIRHVALATLAANPFPDATPEFFTLLEKTLNMAVGGRLEILRPYEMLSKVEVLRRGRDLPLARTLSCIQPVGGRHCGACNKCAERRRAFEQARLPDPTEYARVVPPKHSIPVE